MPIDVENVTREEFGRLKDEWNLLLGQSASDTVFLRWEWIHGWWEVFHGGRTLFVLAAREGGRLVGVAPFYIHRAGALGKRSLRLLSDELYPDALDIFALRGMESKVLRAFWARAAGRGAAWDVLQCDHLQSGALLLSEREVFGGYALESEATANCHHFAMGTDFEDYMRVHPALEKFSLMKKRRRLFETEHVTYKKVEDEASLSKGLRDLFQLHDKRADDKAIRTAFTAEPVKRFHAEVSRLFLEAGILRLQLLYRGEEAISAIYGFKYKNKMYLYQSGMDPEWKRLSAGMVQTRLLVEQAFTEGLEEFDFLKGDEGYKKLWCDAVRHESRLLIYNKSWRGSLALAARRLKAVLRRVKHWLPGFRSPLSPAPASSL